MNLLRPLKNRKILSDDNGKFWSMFVIIRIMKIRKILKKCQRP